MNIDCLVDIIQNELDRRDMKQVELLRDIDIQIDKSGLSNFLKKKTNKLSFVQIAGILRFLFTEDYSTHLSYLCKCASTPASMRMAMEYSSVNRLLDDLELIINKQDGEGRENRNWAEVYRIQLLFQKRNVKAEDLLYMVENYKPLFIETRIFAMILKARILYRLERFETLFTLANQAKDIIPKIKDKTLSVCYSVRANELLAQGHLYVNNDTDISREFALKVINSSEISAVFKSHAYHIMGTSFLFEDYTLAIQYFEVYKETLLKAGRTDLIESVNQDIAFTNFIWGKTSIEEIAFEKLSNYVGMFRDCYSGLIANDFKKLLDSFFKFISTKQLFYANFPAMFLRHHEHYATVVELALKNFKPYQEVI
jgi:hypothetical protein